MREWERQMHCTCTGFDGKPMVIESVAGCQFQPTPVLPDHCKSPNLKTLGVKTTISPMTSQASTKNSHAD